MTKKQIIQILRIVMPLVSIMCLVVFVPWTIVNAWIAPLPDTVKEQLHKAIDKFEFDGMIVYVDERGKPPAYYAAGWNNRKNKIPADTKSLFKIGSIRKLYIAAATAKLVNDQHLSLDKTLAAYLPELADRIQYAEEITLRSMVQHRSGIPNFTDHPGFWESPPQSTEAKLELALDLPAIFEPDKNYGYSNTNYLLIARIIDEAVGYSHQRYIKEEILNPLGLQNTFSSISEVNIDDVMSGYYVGIEADIKTTDYGSMIATAEDVGKFLRALNNGTLFNENEQQIYSTIYEYEHSGLLPGYMSAARYDKDIDAVVVQFVNTANFSDHLFTVHEIICNRIIKILKRKK